ncbi:MAG: bifunctional UDP-N-acetylmuramoyl-tripeptide:D-alanyl-D-alanine ligase/alanine racemase [Bacteroidota bacterium]
MLFSQLERITGGKNLRLTKDQTITSLLLDSRKAVTGDGNIFFAIRGERHDGHQYLKTLYEQGVRQFVVEYETKDLDSLRDANIILVASAIKSLQDLAANRRREIRVPVIGITGSNGKTIIKEWLFQLLSPDYRIAKNPGSYNSQIGVPLSVWQLQPYHQMGIFEAGISKPGEMGKLNGVMQPTIGLFTNIGSAHDEGFKDQQEKIDEKLQLFQHSDVVIYCRDHRSIDTAIRSSKLPALSWGFSEGADIKIQSKGERFHVTSGTLSFDLRLPFKDQASIENCIHCVAMLLYLRYEPEVIQDRITGLRGVPMRLELKEGINQSQIIDDTYNNDLGGLQISLEFLSNQHQKIKKRLILSDILESGLSEETLSKTIAALIAKNNVHYFTGIGPQLCRHKKIFPPNALFFADTEDFLKHFDWNTVHQEVILVKGARAFQFEKIVNRLQRKVHGTIMEIDLGAVVHNLNFFKSRLRPSTKIMVMVKAFAYGSGSTEIANVLQYHKVDYLGVAYADEGVELRKNNISLPIMVMNPSEESFLSLIEHQLEPEIYNFRILDSFLNFLQGRTASIHIKLDTGMHRLGFSDSDLSSLLGILKKNTHLKVRSIFSHLAGADEAQHDQFSHEQAQRFKAQADNISVGLGYRPLYHLINSPGILRLPELQFDMVRLGIGLYGVDPTQEKVDALKPVATLKTVISQITQIPAGDSIGYGRQGKAEKPMTIATIAIGYADGFSRAFSRGVGEVLVNGKAAKVVGNVCMDMTMIDISGIEAQEGDEVIIFGKDYPIQQVAARIGTIAYEILTNTSERVKRVFVAESI